MIKKKIIKMNTILKLLTRGEIRDIKKIYVKYFKTCLKYIYL